MSESRPSSPVVPTRPDPVARRPQSYARLAIGDGMLALGAVSLICAAVGVADDGGDAAVLAATGVVLVSIGITGRRALHRRHRPPPARILTGLVLTWMVLVALGAGVYLATGTIERVDDALVESGAGFSTVALTTLDPSELTVPMQLWRASTQWVGGLIGILMSVVALPLVLRARAAPVASVNRADELLVPTPLTGRRRVVGIYLGVTLACGLAYAAAGLGALDSAVHAMTTMSTGGFSSHPDSFAGTAVEPRLVAIAGMTVAGTSYVVLWWLLRGRLTTLGRSLELRVYLGILIGCTVAVMAFADDLSLTDSAFTAVSAVTTTGFAVTDWTALHGAVLMVLLVFLATGPMSASAGGGLRVVRAWTLVRLTARELRRQLDPNSVVVVKQRGVAIDERSLDETAGYQIAHLGLCSIAAFTLAACGFDLMAAIYTGISVVSSFGPGIGPGAFGDLGDTSAVGRLALLPFMLAGRLTILPLLLALATVFTAQEHGLRRLRRVVRGWRR